jgi:antirestriction protein ArdC
VPAGVALVKNPVQEARTGGSEKRRGRAGRPCAWAARWRGCFAWDAASAHTGGGGSAALTGGSVVLPLVGGSPEACWHMGNWYRVVKTIKGHRYLYDQQTYREGEHVRTLNRYIGRADEVRSGRPSVTTTALFSSPGDFARAVASQFDAPRWGEDLRQQLFGGAERRGIRKITPPFNFGKSVSYDEGGKRRFHARGRVRLAALAGELGLLPEDYDLRSNIGGIAVSGEVTLHSDNLYVQVSQGAMGNDSGIMYRTCRGRRDYSGGQNHFAPLDSLNNPVGLSKRIREDLAREMSATTTLSREPPSSPGIGGGLRPAGVSRDVQTEITNAIVEAIETGRDNGTFQMPWRAIAGRGLPVNAVTHKPYHGINLLYLSVVAGKEGWVNEWASFQQWKERGASVRKGEHGTPIVFYSQFQIHEVEEDEEGNDREVVKSIPVFRYSTVFNIAQVDNPPDRPAPETLVNPIESVGKFIAATSADIRYGGNRAYFSPGADYIQIPPREAFTGSKTSSPTESFYSTILHELCHWTGGGKRLNREHHNRFGDELYAKEELVAEIGAAFACAKLSITPELRDDHVQYVSSWLKILKEDKKAIFTAAAAASRAVEYLEGLQAKMES